MRRFNSVFADLPLTIFEEMSGLARANGAVNLGQGFPDDDEPRAILDAASRALYDYPNQYPPMRGLLELRQAVANHDERFYGLSINPATEVLVTSGATEALAAAFLALLEPGDEVVVFDPAYDSYVPMIRRAGGIPKAVPMRPPSWAWDEAELRKAFSRKTKAVVLNTPMNPTGRVLSRAEMTVIADLALAHDAYVISDEVYEHIVFAPNAHETMLSVPGMRDRAVKIGSAGKTFSMTGFKVGYVTAAPALVKVIAAVHQFLTFTTPPNLQRAVAVGLAQSDADYAKLASDLRTKRDRLTGGLTKLGWTVERSQGTYFVLARITEPDDRAFCLAMVKEKRVAAIPISAFGAQFPVQGYIRFCFAKRDSVLDEALKRLGG
ncbi:MAG: aminotransferase [Clostridia bacterium]|nr:aminotransferase [Deltaproteobacteria bacterium]